MLTWEMALISALATFFLRPSRNSLFNEFFFPSPNSTISNHLNEQPPIATIDNTNQQYSFCLANLNCATHSPTTIHSRTTVTGPLPIHLR